MASGGAEFAAAWAGSPWLTEGIVAIRGDGTFGDREPSGASFLFGSSFCNLSVVAFLILILEIPKSLTIEGCRYFWFGWRTGEIGKDCDWSRVSTFEQSRG